MWGVGGLKVHGICSRRLLYKEVVEAQTMRNLTSGDLGILRVLIQLGITGLKKTRVMSCIC